MPFNNADWSVIYTKPNHEKAVQKQLEFIKIRNYLPVVKTLKCLSHRKIKVEQVLFPSYIFAKPDDVQQYFESLKIPGILYYLRTGGHIAAVNESVINRIKLLSEKSKSHFEITNETISKGEILNIKKGPFKGIACEVIQCKTAYKIVVRMELLQRNVLVELSPDFLSS